METIEAGRVCLFILSISVIIVNPYEVTEVQIQAFKPKGFRASIADAPNLALFAFNGNVNKKIDSDEVGTITGETVHATNGRWVVEAPNVQLKVGDVVKYHVFVSIDRLGYVLDMREFTVKELKDYVELQTHTTTSTTTSAPATPAPECKRSITKLRVGTACVGETIFEDNFDSLQNSKWQVEQYIPLEHPEMPFVSYQRSAVTVTDGKLRIAPALLQFQQGFNNESIYSGTLNLSDGCTADTHSQCSVHAEGASILPPIVSGRITTRTGFAFTYGTVTVRAKLPQGDWLYPEILLEPFVKKFGIGNLNFRSGILKIAAARGNKNLFESRGSDYGNKLLYAGLILEKDCHDSLLFERRLNDAFWGDDYHIYSVKWTPERITLSVDGEELVQIAPTPGGLRARLPSYCRGTTQPGMAPFDDHFYLTLGLAAGGITEFPDNSYTTTHAERKPWGNGARKAVLNFWQKIDTWHATWQNPELLVDYVKVVAL